MFKKNAEIKKDLSKSPSIFMLVTINPNFEELIGISPTGSDKPFKAFNYVKNLDDTSVNKSIKDIITQISSFSYNSKRKTLKELSISV